MNARSLPLTVVILTLNEERNLPACLASVAAADDVVVLDSGSTDRTVDLARAAGARVFTNPFRDFAQQRNHAHEALPLVHPWVFHLDADELMSPELLTECASLQKADDVDGYFAAPRMMFHGTWLRRCTDFPAWQARFVRRNRFRFIQVGHGQREAADMRMGYLQGGYAHDISVSDLADWERKHRRYAREEASRALAESKPVGDLLGDIVNSHHLVRRRALKQLSYHLPGRPLLRLIYQYLLRGGFFDGRGAWRYCRLIARYERYATEELQTLRRQRPA